uniref:Uncharacterized protein n=1 Tax=Helianthus annuus TaxID=4232 RepID=A0A251RWJ7_HELAN
MGVFETKRHAMMTTQRHRQWWAKSNSAQRCPPHFCFFLKMSHKKHMIVQIYLGQMKTPMSLSHPDQTKPTNLSPKTPMSNQKTMTFQIHLD